MIEIACGPNQCESRLPEKAKDTYSAKAADLKRCKVF